MLKNKMKTHKALKKRVKITAKKAWVRRSAHISHLAASKTKKQKKRLDQNQIVKKVDFQRLKDLI